MENYEELKDFLDEWTCDEFFAGIDEDSFEDENLKTLFVKAEKAYWDLRDYLEKKGSK